MFWARLHLPNSEDGLLGGADKSSRNALSSSSRRKAPSVDNSGNHDVRLIVRVWDALLRMGWHTHGQEGDQVIDCGDRQVIPQG